MSIEAILERLEQKPFRPFAVETVGGTWIEIDRESDALVYNRARFKARIVLFNPNGRLYVLEPADIATLELR